ncbi:MAG: glycerophosphodiester phosphodiesterase family protein, partial [Bacteroidota bacterium]
SRSVMITVTILLIFAFLLFLLPYLSFKSTKLPTTVHHTSAVKSVGHRGAAAYAPENTLASIGKALEIGVDYIELDVHLTKDNQVVIIHDPNTRRTTGSDSEVADLTLEEIKGLDAGSWFSPSFTNERIPTLLEALQLINGRCGLLIELKWPRKGIYDRLAAEILAIIAPFQSMSPIILQSFEPRYLQEIHQQQPSLKMHQLLIGDAVLLPLYHQRNLQLGHFSPVAGVTSVNTYYPYITEKMRQRYGVEELGVFTVNTEEDIAKSIANGATYIISDKPDLIHQCLNKLK